MSFPADSEASGKTSRVNINEQDDDVGTALLNGKEGARARNMLFFRALAAEFLGTASFIFIVCCEALNINDADKDSSNVLLRKLGGSFTAGISLMVLAFVFAEVSGAHFNPAVTFGTRVAGKMSNRRAFGYIAAQLIGSTLSLLLVVACFDGNIKALATELTTGLLPEKEDLGRVFLREVVTTGLFVFVIFGVAFDLSNSEQEKVSVFKNEQVGLTMYTPTPRSFAGFAPLAIGSAVTVLSFCGGVFNPARLWGPALVSGHWKNQYIYWLGDFLGATIAVILRQAFVQCFKVDPTETRWHHIMHVAGDIVGNVVHPNHPR